MSEHAWRILSILLEARQKPDHTSYLAGWHIADRLGVERSAFNTRIPGTIYDEALGDLIEKGLVEELPDLRQRYRIVITAKE